MNFFDSSHIVVSKILSDKVVKSCLDQTHENEISWDVISFPPLSASSGSTGSIPGVRRLLSLLV
jgi:hypothetical protein